MPIIKYAIEKGEKSSEDGFAMTKFLIGGPEMLVIFVSFCTAMSREKTGAGKISPSLLMPIMASVCHIIE
jgi:hypothetical protein